jgi:hypothetical protein
MDLRDQVDEALTGYRSTLERQLEALGSSVASLGGKVARHPRKQIERDEGCAKARNAPRDWLHLALRKPVTSRAVAGRYGRHRMIAVALVALLRLRSTRR